VATAEEYMSRLPEFDAEMEAQRREAEGNGEVRSGCSPSLDLYCLVLYFHCTASDLFCGVVHRKASIGVTA